MALTQIKTTAIADDAVTTDKLANAINTERTANTAKTTNATHTGEVTGSGALTITDDIIDEANLKVDNSPTNDYVLTAKSSAAGGLTWAAAASGVGGATGVDFNDNVATRYGDSNELQIKHSSSGKSIIYHSPASAVLSIAADHLNLADYGNEHAFITCDRDGAVELYFDNAKKFETTSDGGTVTGNLTVTTGNSILTNSSQGQLTVKGGASYPGGGIKFAGGQSGTTDRGTTIFYNSDDTNLAERMRIASDGKIGIGTANTFKNAHSLLNVHKGTSDSNYMYFTNTTTGETGSDGFTIGIDGDEQALLWNRENTDMRFATNGTERMRIRAAGGLCFNGDTANANALNDYEQGSFTPILRKSGDSTGQVSGTGAYTKIGNVVHAKICFANKACSNIPNGAVAEIVGLPFNAHHGTHTDEMAISGPMVEMGIAQRNGGIFRTTTATSYLRAYYMNNNSTWSVWYVDDFNNSGVYLIFGITYLTT